MVLMVYFLLGYSVLLLHKELLWRSYYGGKLNLVPKFWAEYFIILVWPGWLILLLVAVYLDRTHV